METFENVVAVVITGSVTNEQGATLQGVSVNVKGSNVGTTTDGLGKYSLNVPDGGGALIFSSIGYADQEVNIGGRTTINVILRESVKAMDDVVVVGYGTVRKSDLTGSVVSLNSKQLNPGIQVSIDQMIQGRAAGVQVTQNSSEPGGGVAIRIRGVSSLTAGNDPLYVIDGLPIDNSLVTPGSSVTLDRSPRNPLNTINPGDIESIEILKDASSTAIYGSRGSNGVILITTKKGKKGATAVNYGTSIGVQEVAKKLDLLNATEYMKLLNDLNKDQAVPPVFTDAEVSAAGAGTDWQDEIFRSAAVQNHQLSVSGGSESTKYYASFNYLNQRGVIINSGIKRYGARLNLSHTANKFNFGMNLNTGMVIDDFIASGVSINQEAGVLATSLQMMPTLPVRNADGTYAQTNVLDLENPVGLAMGVVDNAETNRTFGNVFAEYAILENLKAKINFGSDRQTSRRDSYVTRATKRGARAGGEANVASNERSNYLVELTLNYNKRFNDNHRIDAVAGFTYQEFLRRNLSARGLNFPTDAFLGNNLAAGTQSNFLMGSFKSKNQLQSYLGRVNYTLFNKYLFTGSFRADGSSRFGQDTKYGYFPSVALGWRLIDENFIRNLKAFNDLKLRISYGVTGNQEIGSYNSLNLLGTTLRPAILGGTQLVGIAPNQIANPNLKWETTHQFNVGLDYAVLKGRISGSVDYFKKNTSDLLLNLPIPNTTGFSTSLQNVGSTTNDGFEILINTDNVKSKSFTWSTSLNLSVVKNKVTDLGGLPQVLQGGARFVNDISILRIGDPINAYFGYVVDGIFQSAAEVTGSAQPGARPGELRYKDVNNDKAITTADRVILGSPYPDFTAGLNNSFSYKGFDLSVFLEGVYGSEIFNFNRIESENPISSNRNRQSYVLDRWTPTNLTNENPSFIDPKVSYGSLVNTRAVEDASYTRVKNVRLGYNFTSIRNKHIKSASVYFTGQNLFTFTNYTGYNPDVSSFADTNIRVDYNSYPLAKIYTIGLNVGF
ncbi:MAG TPA: TonB-dependent receptor [Segetibacter sp.]